MNKKLIFLLFSIFLLTIGLAIPQKINANSINSLGISPSLIDNISLKPGEEGKYKLTIINKSPETKKVRLEIRAFVSGKTAGIPIFYDENGDLISSPITEWVSFEKQTFNIKPQENKKIDFTISIPKNAVPKAYSAAIFAQEINSNSESIKINPEVGTLVILNVAGAESDNLNITKFKIKKAFLSSQLSFLIELKNDTPNYLKPAVSIDIHNIFGRKIKTVKLENKNLLPQDKRNWETAIEIPKNTIGIYKANLKVLFDGRRKSEIIRFFAISKAMFYVSILILLIIILIILLLFRQRKVRSLR